LQLQYFNNLHSEPTLKRQCLFLTFFLVAGSSDFENIKEVMIDAEFRKMASLPAMLGECMTFNTD
jgi:hypothetical protein